MIGERLSFSALTHVYLLTVRVAVIVTLDHRHTSNSVGLLWRRDRPITETSLPDNTQHSKETDIHAPGGIRTRNSGM